MRCEICKKEIKENTDGNMRYCQGHSIFEVEDTKEKDIAELWHKFKDVPINGDDCIDVDFHIWEKGTDKMEVWHWFDENSKNGVVYMLNNY